MSVLTIAAATSAPHHMQLSPSLIKSLGASAGFGSALWLLAGSPFWSTGARGLGARSVPAKGNKGGHSSPILSSLGTPHRVGGHFS